MPGYKSSVSTDVSTLALVDAAFTRALMLCELSDGLTDARSFIRAAKPGRVYMSAPLSIQALNSLASELGSGLRFESGRKGGVLCSGERKRLSISVVSPQRYL